MNNLKTKIEQGSVLTLETLGATHYDGATANEIIYLSSEDYKELALYALEKNKEEYFKLIAENESQKMAEKLQVERLKKEIEKGNAPNLKQNFSCMVSEEVTEEKTGYTSASQDYEDTYTRTETKKDSFQLADESKVALVEHALKQNKHDIAKQLVVHLSNDDLKKFTQHSVLGKTAQEEVKKNELIGKLNSLEKKIEASKTGYEKRASATFDWFRSGTVADKNAECVAMLTEITRLKDLLNEHKNESKEWKLDDKKSALKDKKTLHGHASELNKLKEKIEKFMQPALVAASSPTAAASS